MAFSDFQFCFLLVQFHFFLLIFMKFQRLTQSSLCVAFLVLTLPWGALLKSKHDANLDVEVSFL